MTTHRSGLALAAAIAFATAGGVCAQTATYEAASQQLTLPSVQVGGTTYSNVVIRLDSFAVLAVGGTSSGGTVAATCTSSNFTVAKYNAIQAGMTLQQVNEVIGCEPNPTSTVRGQDFVHYTWNTSSSPYMSIGAYFVADGSRVQSGQYFKSSSGF